MSHIWEEAPDEFYEKYFAGQEIDFRFLYFRCTKCGTIMAKPNKLQSNLSLCYLYNYYYDSNFKILQRSCEEILMEEALK